MRITETTAKSMLVASKLPDADYVVNPYTGCSFACVYCYASFMGRFVDEPIESWGEYLSVKTNAAQVFRAELARLKPDKRTRSIFIASVTDAWQGVEKKYRLTRGVLEALVDARYEGMVGALTKSPLILRDADLFAALPRAEVGMTITTTDDAIGRFMEVHAPMAADRLQTLRDLNAAGLNTYAFVGPLFPHYRYRPDLLDGLFHAIADAGTRHVYVEHLNTSPYILQRIAPVVAQQDADVRAVYAGAGTHDHRSALTEMVLELVAKYDMTLRTGRVIDHGKKAVVV